MDKIKEIPPLVDGSGQRFKPDFKGFSSCIQCEKDMAQKQRDADIKFFQALIDKEKAEIGNKLSEMVWGSFWGSAIGQQKEYRISKEGYDYVKALKGDLK